MNSDFATRGVLLMWLGAIAITAWKEFGNPKNIDRPLPRPCKLIPPSIGYTGLGALAQFWPSGAFLIAVGLAVSEVVAQQNPVSSIFQQLADSISRENASVAKAG